jgi:probable HAF family extracellular repeat protein
VGDAQKSTGVSHAFLYQDSVMQDLGTLGGATSSAWGIGCSTLIVGRSDTSSGSSHAFLYADGVMRDLGTLGGPNSAARAVNPSGQIVGFADTTATVPAPFGPSNVSHAFLYSKGVMQDLGALPTGSFSDAHAINAAGDIAGESQIGTGTLTHAFLYRHGVMQDIGSLPGATNTQVTGMNSSGHIVGYASPLASDPSGMSHGFLYSRGTMVDLNDLVDPSDPLAPYAKIEQGVSINDAGVILAQGHDSRGNVPHSYLLTPSTMVSESTLVSLPALCVADTSSTSSSSSSSSKTSNITSGAAPMDQATMTGSSASTGGAGAVDSLTLSFLVSLIVTAQLSAITRKPKHSNRSSA